MYSGHHFVTGARVLASPDGVPVVATHPELQMGPLTLVVALGIVSWGGAGAIVVAGAGMLLLGALVLTMVLLLRPVDSGTQLMSHLPTITTPAVAPVEDPRFVTTEREAAP